MPYPNKSHSVSPTIVAARLNRAAWEKETREYLKSYAIGTAVRERIWKRGLEIRKDQPAHLPWPIYPWCIKQAAIEFGYIF